MPDRTIFKNLHFGSFSRFSSEIECKIGKTETGFGCHLKDTAHSTVYAESLGFVCFFVYRLELGGCALKAVVNCFADSFWRAEFDLDTLKVLLVQSL